VALGDYAARSVLPEIQRLPGVGQAQLFGTERAMRIWIDPARLLGLNLSAAEVTAAIRAQNAQVSAGRSATCPTWPARASSPPWSSMASSPAWSSSATGGAARQCRRLHRAPADVARIELGAQTYATSARLNGKPSTGIGVQLAPTGNALATAKAVRTA
jgi:multidrug efflux pump